MSGKDDDLLTLYQVAVDDIRDSKHQQWRIIELTLIAIAAIVTIPSYIQKCGNNIPDWWLITVLCTVGVIGITFIWLFAYSLCKFRKKKRLIRRHFNETAKTIEKKTSLWDSSFERNIIEKILVSSVFFAGIFSLLIVIAIVLAIFIILKT